MSRAFLSRSASLSRARKQSPSEFVPFSYTLFLLAVFHVAVWSLGVACPPAQGYFTAHTGSFKCCDQGALPAPFIDLLAAQQQSQEYIRASQQALKLVREREASQAHGVAALEQAADPIHQESGQATALLATLAFLTAFTSGAGQSTEAAAAVNKQALSV